MMVTFGGTAFTDTISVLTTSNADWWWPVTMIRVAGSGCVFTFFYVFPDGQFVPRWTRFAAVGWLLWCLVGYFSPADSPVNQANPNDSPFLVGVFGFLVAGVAAQVYRYRRISSPTTRKNTVIRPSLIQKCSDSALSRAPKPSVSGACHRAS